MILKSQKGYSLLEIGIGLLILTVFLICSAVLFNGCYNTYRMIQQRNLAINYATAAMEELLQTDADILTGFFAQELNPTTNEYELKIQDEFLNFVEDNFENKFKERYAVYNNSSVSENLPSADDLKKYILYDSTFLINAFIEDEVNGYTNEEFKSEKVREGNYGFLTSNVVETGNPILLNPDTGTPSSIAGEMAIRKTILRLAPTDDNAYGNKVLKLKVQVFYTNKVNLQNLTQNDIHSVVLESVKIAK